ncbi:membrane-targeted effector domain-containing toxin [Pseudomonas fildesensis]|uniref:membrane-targeted effector domain-containing toxin n=1 Tax=Pseudomonas fildesensis TaxID=1674920 RepID=UPI00137931E3|nr:membrane-targeted effector domain-containing toxin [Pseudomonas fildesensis]
MTITASAAHLPLPQHNQSAIRPDSNTPLTANTPPDSRALGDNQLTQNMISAMNKRKDYQQEPVQIPPSSTLGQWRTQLAFALKNPEFQDWIKDTRIAPGSIVIFPDTDSISVAINHRRVTFTPNDSSGWSSVAAPVLAAGEVIAGGSGDPIHYNDAFRDTVEVRKVASFYGSPVMERMIHKETASTHTNAEPGQIFQPRHHPEYGDYALHKQRQAVADIYHRHTEQIPPTEDNSNDKKVDPRQKPAPVASPDSELYSARATIYGSDTISPPTTGYTVEERLQHIDAFAKRVKNHIGDIESGNEGARNVKFQNARLLTEPAGYFSAGLLAAGYDPHEKITVTFTSYTGMGKPDVLTHTDKRTYFAWEIAAGALAHDKVQRGGPINFNFMHIESQDRSKVKDLESLGEKLQNHWEAEIAKPMRVASGAVAQRSGKADAYVIRATLQNLRDNEDSIETLSPAGQEAVNRTLDNNGQVIIPNLYGYPLAGYAFIPYTPYNGDYEHRPNKGLMVDLRNGSVREINGDDAFASWAKDNREHVLRSFNASNRQGGKDAHWPRAGYVLDCLIQDNKSRFPGYYNAFSDQSIPVRELFNYTLSRDSDYQLKHGDLESGIASHYQALNANNAVWSDQTEVFGSSQQNWKAAKDLWGNTFGYVPVVGNAGNIVFGVHDSIYGMKADDRVGGNAAAVLSSLQLVHEVALIAAEPLLGEADAIVDSAAIQHYSWTYNAQTKDFELVRVPKASSSTDDVIVPKEEESEDKPETGKVDGAPPTEPGVNRLSPSQAGNISQYAVPNGEQLIENAVRNSKGIYQLKDETTGNDYWFVRYTDATGVPQVYEIRGNFRLKNNYVQIIDPDTRKPVMTVHAKPDGKWGSNDILGGRRHLGRSLPPTDSVYMDRVLAGNAINDINDGAAAIGQIRRWFRRDMDIFYDNLATNGMPTRPELPVMTINSTPESAIQSTLSQPGVRGLVIGEMHDEPSAYQLVIDKMKHFKASGVSTLYVEGAPFIQGSSNIADAALLPSDAPYFGPHAYSADYTGGPTLLDVINEADKHGIKVIGLEHQQLTWRTDDRMHIYTHAQGVEDRLKEFNYHAVKIIERTPPGGKFVAIVGKSHMNTDLGVPCIAELTDSVGVSVSPSLKGSSSLVSQPPHTPPPSLKFEHGSNTPQPSGDIHLDYNIDALTV